jgi:hypothetical protein
VSPISRGAEGVSSIHTVQPWVDGTAPTLEKGAAFMESAGFTQILRETFARRVVKTSLASRFSYSTKWKAVLKKV